VPVLGNAAFAVRVTQGLPLTACAMFGDVQPGATPLGGGCTWWLGLPAPLSIFAGTDGIGTASVNVPVPGAAALVGLQAFFQWALIDPNGAFAGAASFSDGLFVQVGT
jgi:hypothetical protein